MQVAKFFVWVERNQLQIHQDYSEVSNDHLIQLVANRIIESNPIAANESVAANQRKTIDDVISVLPKLLVGLDVNVRFRQVTDFEYTPEMATFDLLDMTMYHGWLLDEQDRDTVSTGAFSSVLTGC